MPSGTVPDTLIIMLKIVNDNHIVGEADDGDGDLREWVAKPMFEHLATCSKVANRPKERFVTAPACVSVCCFIV